MNFYNKSKLRTSYSTIFFRLLATFRARSISIFTERKLKTTVGPKICIRQKDDSTKIMRAEILNVQDFCLEKVGFLQHELNAYSK